MSLDLWALLVALLFLALFWALWNRRAPPLRIRMTKVSDFEGHVARGVKWPDRLKLLALGLFVFAFINPSFVFEEEVAPPMEKPPREGIALYFAIDQSSSMEGEVSALEVKGGFVSKFDLVKGLTRAFVQGDPAWQLQGRRDDMIGLLGFARAAEVYAPLTLDHQAVLEQLNALQIKKKREEDGTSIGYALFKLAHLIAATRHFSEESEAPDYQIKSSVVILLTDGFQNPNPLDQGNRYRMIDPLEAARYAKEQNVRLYIINVDPRISQEAFAPQRRQMQQVAEVTGGRFFTVENGRSLSSIYKDVDALEKSRTAQLHLPPMRKKRFPLYPYLIALGLGTLFLAIVLETTRYRRVP